MKIPLQVRRLISVINEKLGLFGEALSIFILGLILVACGLKFGIGNLSDLISIFSSFIVASISIFIYRRATYRHTMLIEITMSYLVEGDKYLFDEVLGKLISGGWHQEELRPGVTLFKVVEKICNGHNWELKRRIAEAIPSLSEIDLNLTLRIMAILRSDWEPILMLSDIRRRVVESLGITTRVGQIPLIFRIRPIIIEQILQLRENDEVFTAFAVIETLYLWKEIQPKKAESLLNNVNIFSRKTYSKQERSAIKELITLLSSIKDQDPLDLIQRIKKLSCSENVYVRIIACRSILHIPIRFPELIINLMFTFTELSQPKNVRRPIARERSLNLIIHFLENRETEEKAKQLLFRLLSDPDEMVRIPTFDKIGLIIEKDNLLAREICDFLIESDPSIILRNRALQIRNHLTYKS